MDTIFRKYRSKGEVWQLGWNRALFWTPAEGGGQPFRPCILVCLSLRTGRQQSMVPGTAEPEPEAFRDLVTRAARAWRLRPERIEVTDARLAEDLRGFLSNEQVRVELRTDLLELRTLLEEEAAAIREELPPAALDASGITVERMAAFAGAAARFTSAAPWRHLGVDDLLRLESAGLPEDLRFARMNRPPEGTVQIQFSPEPLEDFGREEESDWDEDGWEDDDWHMEPGEDEIPPDPWTVSFVPPSELPPEDVELWIERGLPLAHLDAYPLALRPLADGAERPDARVLSWLGAVLDALASTTEEEMDSVRWEKEVVTPDGPVRLALSLPDVLDPPYADSLPREEVPDDLSLACEIATEAAHGASGRRQIHLARRAVALWPDCIEGWLVLARRALDPESTRDLYARALAAGEKLFPRMARRAEPLDEEDRRAAAPYLWARSGLARTLWSLGDREEALGHFRWLLAVAPDDRRSVQYVAHALLALGRDEEAEDLLARHADTEPGWRYVRALLAFRREGDCPGARRQMAAAIQEDRHIARQLLGIGQPDEDEEGRRAVLFRDVWTETPGALEALRVQSEASAALIKARKAKRKVEKKKRRRR